MEEQFCKARKPQATHLDPASLQPASSHQRSHRAAGAASGCSGTAGKTTRPFRYDLNQIPYDYTVEVRNRFKGLDLIDRVPDELWNEVRDIVQETGIKTIPIEKKWQKSPHIWTAKEINFFRDQTQVSYLAG